MRGRMKENESKVKNEFTITEHSSTQIHCLLNCLLTFTYKYFANNKTSGKNGKANYKTQKDELNIEKITLILAIAFKSVSLLERNVHLSSFFSVFLFVENFIRDFTNTWPPN